MKSKWIVSITAGWAQTHSIKRCKEMGLNVLSVDENPKAIGFKFSDEYLISKIDDLDNIINFMNSKKIMPSGIIGFVSDAAIVPVGMLRKHYNLSSQKLSLLKDQINKERLISLFIENKIKIPKSLVVANLEHAKDLLKTINFPFISKPTLGSGSRGVNKIESKKDIKKINDSFLNSQNKKIILQEFIDGDELSIETFCHKKEVKFLATSKRKINESMSATDIFTYNIDEETSRKVINEIEKIYMLFEYPDGPGHFELILDKNLNIYIIDVHFRGGGFGIYNYLVKEVSGFDIVYNTIMQCINLKINLNYNKEKNIAHIKFLSGDKGILKKIDGIKSVEKMENVKVKTFYKIGDKIHHNYSDGDRIAMVICVEKNIESCNKLLSNAVEKINIEIE